MTASHLKFSAALVIATLVAPVFFGITEGNVRAANELVSYDTFDGSFDGSKWMTSFGGSESKRSVSVSDGRLRINADGRGAPDDNTRAEVKSVTDVGAGVSFDLTGDFGGSYNFGYAGITDGTKYIYVQLNRNGNGNNVVLVGMSGWTQLENSAEYDTSTIPFTEGIMKRFTIEELNGEIKVTMDGTVIARFSGTIPAGTKFRAAAHAASAPDRYAFVQMDNLGFYAAGQTQSSSSSTSSAAPFELIMDNDNPAYFSEVGPWSKTEAETAGYNGLSYHYIPRGDGSATATWRAEGIPSGRYDVQTTWTHHINRASNAPFTIIDGTKNRGTVRVSEENIPQGFTVNGWPFQSIGQFDIISGSVTVRLTNDADEYVISDTVRLVRVGNVAPASSSSSAAPAPEPVRDPILFSLPDFPDNGRVMEGDWVKTEVKNGIPESAIYIDVLYDGETVYSHGFAETDTAGNGFVRFQMPHKLLKDGHNEDGLVIRLGHAEIAYNQPFTLIKGLNIIVPKEIKEGEPFTYEVQRSAGETAIEAGIDYDAGADPRFAMRQTDGSGNAHITEEIGNLVTNGAERDGAEFWVKTKDVTWYFPITLVNTNIVRDPVPKAPVTKIQGVGGGTIYPVATSATPHRIASVHSADQSRMQSPTLYEKSKNTLVAIMYGSNQEFDDQTGLKDLYFGLRGKLKNVHRFLTGKNISAESPFSKVTLRSYEDQMQMNKDAIKALLNSKPEINSVILIGHSWGGTAAYDLSYWLKSEYPQIRILGMGYVDAIYYPSFDPLTSIHPLAESAFNLYQSIPSCTACFNEGFLVGSNLSNTFNLTPLNNFSSVHGTFTNGNFDSAGYNVDLIGHGGIDDLPQINTLLQLYTTSLIDQIFGQ